MTSSKARLVIRKKRREVNITSEPFHQEFFKNLRRDSKEANRSKRGDVIDGFARFWYPYDNKRLNASTIFVSVREKINFFLYKVN